MLIYTGKYEELEFYGFEDQQNYLHSYRKCIDRGFLFLTIEKDYPMSEYVLGNRDDIPGQIKLYQSCVSTNYQPKRLCDFETIKYIQDLINDGKVMECTIDNFRIKYSHKVLPPQLVVHNDLEPPKRKVRV